MIHLVYTETKYPVERLSVSALPCYIGREANELEESEILGLDDEAYVEYRKVQ